MQRFSESDAKYSYSPDHESIGTVEPGERFEVESVEGWSNYFRDPSDFTPESHAQAEAQKWAVVGPISVAGAERNGAVAVTIHEVEITTPGVVVYGAYSGVGPSRMVGRRDGGRALFRGERSSSVRRAHDPPDPSADRLPRRHARGGISSRDAAGSLRREPRLPRGAQGGHPGIARGARRGRPLFRRLQGADGGRRDHRTARGRSARHRERGASRTAGLDGMAAHRDERELDHARLRQTPRVERTPCVSRTAQLGGGRLRALAGRGPRCFLRWLRTPASARSAIRTTPPTAPFSSRCFCPTHGRDRGGTGRLGVVVRRPAKSVPVGSRSCRRTGRRSRSTPTEPPMSSSWGPGLPASRRRSSSCAPAWAACCCSSAIAWPAELLATTRGSSRPTSSGRCRTSRLSSAGKRPPRRSVMSRRRTGCSTSSSARRAPRCGSSGSRATWGCSTVTSSRCTCGACRFVSGRACCSRRA